MRERLLHQFFVLPEQDGIDDGLVIEEPDASAPQVGPPIMSREIFWHTTMLESLVDRHRYFFSNPRGLCGALANSLS